MAMRAGTRVSGILPKVITRADWRGPLFRKYILLFVGVVCAALAANVLFDIWFYFREQRALLIRIQQEQANAAAAKIGQFVKGIEDQMGWTTQVSWAAGDLEQRRFEALRLLRQVPAITELALLDATGRERLKLSRVALNVVDSGIDRSTEPAFVEATSRTVYYGPVYFRQESEPYMTIGLAGARREAGICIAEVNLVFIWDVVSQIKVGQGGRAYLIDVEGRLIAHPDISLVLTNSNFSHLPQVRAARAEQPLGEEPLRGMQGGWVLSAHAFIAPLGWLVFIELPIAEAYAPIYASMLRSGVLFAGALLLAFVTGVVLIRRMVVPIQALRQGAERIGGGDLGQRISIKTGDELEALGDQFNSMAARLEDSYATLERKVEERTHQLHEANLAKSRFLAAATHDLRQPLHALGLFVAELRARLDATDRKRIIERIESALGAMNELFGALLDISKLDAGVVAPDPSDFPLERLFKRIETTFAAAASEKGLRLRMVSTRAWVRSDFILLERILLNLVGNAVRYTRKGGVVIGCRRRGRQLRIEVCDSGIGIPEREQRNVFGEFYRLADPEGDRAGGIGLGLAVVDRLCRLLDHPVALRSRPGKGSCFSVSVPIVAVHSEAPRRPPLLEGIGDTSGKLIVVIDDDALVLEGMSRLLRTWGCQVVPATSDKSALAKLAGYDRLPDLIISDYRLPDGVSGFHVIAQLRSALHAAIPAFLITGDTAPERLREADASGFHLLHKPVSPMALRAMLNQLLSDRAGGRL
jgi:signal transduction histidine kinase